MTDREIVLQIGKEVDSEGHFITDMVSHCHYNRIINDKDFEKPITIDKSMNWNSEYFNGEFDNDYICYAIHYMLDTHAWSFADVLSIGDIWVNVEVTHQYNKKIPKEKVVPGEY